MFKSQKFNISQSDYNEYWNEDTQRFDHPEEYSGEPEPLKQFLEYNKLNY